MWDQRICMVNHFIQNQEIYFCLNCDDWIQDKGKVLNQGWSLFDEAGKLLCFSNFIVAYVNVVVNDAKYR